MDKLLKNVLSCMRTKGLLDENEEDVYRFGLECLLLEVVHYLSYIVIGFAMRMIIPMIVTAMVLIPLRRKSGGFHARTRSGCYLFSCSIEKRSIWFSTPVFKLAGLISNDSSMNIS